MASSYLVGFFSSVPNGLVSLGVGLWGVALARWVFVNRENRRLPRPQPWRETVPLTLVAMLITAVIVRDQELGLSTAAFTGLGVGWAAVLLLDILGERITAAFRAGFAMPTPRHIRDHADLSGHGGTMLDDDVEIPPDLIEPLEHLHEVDDPRKS